MSAPATPFAIAAWLCYVVAVLPARAQPPAPVNAQRLEQSRELGQAALIDLRMGKLETAMERFALASDLQLPLNFQNDGGHAAAAGAWHRALAQLSSEERYELLHDWTIPGDAPTELRTLTTLVPTDAPPAEFARALGERPRTHSFPIASIGELRGVFSTAWQLVEAAEDAGKLGKLTLELEQLAGKNVRHADWLWVLAQLAGNRANASQLATPLMARLAALNVGIVGTGAGPTSFDAADVVLAAAALRHEPLRAISADIFAALVERSYGQPATWWRPFLREAHATAVLLSHGGNAAELETRRLKYWVPVSSGAVAGREGSVEANWLVHEEHVLHLAGSNHDLLLFRFPLAGNFEFRCETQDGGRIETDGGLAFAGQSFQVLGSRTEFSMWDANGDRLVRRPCPFVKYGNRPAFNRLAVAMSDGKAAFIVNRHPMTSGAAAASSPWLGLRSFGERRPLFRNLTFIGHPVIPREVRLLEGPELCGWQSRFFSERQPVKSGLAEQDWQLADGVLQAARMDDGPRWRWLRYQRPLLTGESVSYEFFFEPGVSEVHPALGRVAFLMAADGVRLHWITTDDTEWTTLPEDNAIVEPLNRRGPRPLPLKEKDWNHITLARTEKLTTVTLNGTLVYQRPVDWRGDERPGFFGNPQNAGAQVRNVVLTGDWPETLPQDVLENPTITTGEPPSVATQQAVNAIIDDEFLAENVTALRARTAAMPVDERFRTLTAWILPGSDRRTIRLSGHFTQTHPIPMPEQQSSTGSGSDLVSPVFDWLDAGKTLNQLAAMRQQVEAAEIADRDQQRARDALLTLVSLELGDFTAATEACARLHAAVKDTTPAGIEDQWPEMLVVWRGAHRFPDQPAIADLLTYIHTQRTLQWRPEGIYTWHNRIGALAGLYRQRELATATPPVVPQNPPSDWIPTTTAKAATRGLGHPVAQWQWTDNRAVKYAGHDCDYIFYRYPLRGDFEVECELTEPGHTPNQVLLGGTFVGPRWNRKEIEVGVVRGNNAMLPLDPPMSTFGPWVRYRAVVRKGSYTVSFNGRKVHTAPLPAAPDPWLAIRVWGRFHGGVQNVRIFGNPTVPEDVPLSESPDLIGWYAYYQQDYVGPATVRWYHVEDPESSGWIVGRMDAGLKGTNSESVLQYQRPLVNGDSVEYEFYYVPGQVDTAPALDRLAFILDSHGVREHWITDDRYEQSDISPGNLFDLPEHRRGPAELPLNIEAWNRLKILLSDDTARLELNGQLIYERPVTEIAQRTLGLFHFIDRTEVRVRNVIMRGDWPKTLPPVSEQQLAGNLDNPLDADLPRLKAVFTHDFAKEGLPDEYFKAPTAPVMTVSAPAPKAEVAPILRLFIPQPERPRVFNAVQPVLAANAPGVVLSPQGVRTVRPSTGNWSGLQLITRFAVHGDFDAEATFEDFQAQSDKDTDIKLLVMLNDERKQHCRVTRSRAGTGKHDFRSSLAILHADGSRSYPSQFAPSEATGGRLRVARRGDRVSFLFAEGDSPVFRLISTETVSAADSERAGVRLETSSTGTGTSSVLWKDITIRAERMTYFHDGQAERQLIVMRPDGSDLRVVARPKEAGFRNVGSPEWSADGKKIGMDMSNGSTSTSHIFVIDADGSNRKDLGPGCMPSFSPDGKKIVFSESGNGIVMMNADGSNREVLDRSGWATQWSPNGKHICWGKSGNINVRDVATGKDRWLLTGDAANRYGYIYWNPGWSHDSRSIAFKGRWRDNNQDEIAVADLDATNSFKVLVPSASGMGPDMTFTPDNSGVVFSMTNPAAQAMQLYIADRKQPGAPRLLPKQPPGYRVLDGDWSSDGNWIVAATEVIPQPIEWTSKPAAP